MQKRSPHTTVQVGLRLKESLRRLLEIEAKKAGRSLNQEMASRLERSFDLEIELMQAKLKLDEGDLAKTLLSIATASELRRAQRRLYGLLDPKGRAGQVIPEDEK